MATAAKTGPQDLPPPGGYGRIQWERVKLKTFFDVKTTLFIWLTSTAIGSVGYVMAHRKYHRERVELRSARHAILPMLMAERDRAFLKQLGVNREIEKELMKNDPDWEVGTYYREPIYLTTQDKFNEPHYFEFYAHGDYWDVTFRTLRRHFT